MRQAFAEGLHQASDGERPAGGGATTCQPAGTHTPAKVRLAESAQLCWLQSPGAQGRVHLPDLFLVRPCQRFQLRPPSFTTAAISLLALMGHFCMHFCMHACSERNTLHCSSAAPSIKYPFNYPLNLLNQLKMHLLVLAQIHEDGENPC